MPPRVWLCIKPANGVVVYYVANADVPRSPKPVKCILAKLQVVRVIKRRVQISNNAGYHASRRLLS